MYVCDCMKEYWHQQLDEDSSFLTTFKTDLGTFRYTVMPFGVTVAGDVFQHKLDQCFGHIKLVIAIKLKLKLCMYIATFQMGYALPRALYM